MNKKTLVAAAALLFAAGTVSADIVEIASIPSSFETDFIVTTRVSGRNWDVAFMNNSNQIINVGGQNLQKEVFGSLGSTGDITANFNFSFDGTKAVYSIQNGSGNWESLTYYPPNAAAINDFYLWANAAEYPDITFSSLTLSQGDFSTPITITEGQQKILHVSEPIPFSLTGTANFKWQSTNSTIDGNRLAFYIKSGENHNVPEPGVMFLLGSGLLVLASRFLRRK